MNSILFQEFCIEQGYANVTLFPPVGWCGLHRFMFTTGLVVGITETGYRGRYCFHSWNEAKDALKNWNGIDDPPGEWIKYKGEGGERSRVIDE